MFVRITLLSCLLLPHSAAADTFVSFLSGNVTWEATGVVNRGFTVREDKPFPPIGTPYSLTLTFNPSAAFPTPIGVPGSGCLAVNVSGSLELGGASYVGSGFGFTHAQLPGTNCVGPIGGFTQFGIGLTPVGETPWDVTGSLLIASYRDLLMPNAFPLVPTGTGAWWISSPVERAIWEAGALWAPSAVSVEQPAPVPEPGTMTLFALGLAAAARRLRSTRH
jgi:hypothetical protein